MADIVPAPSSSTLFIFKGDDIYMAEMELSPALQEMLSAPVGDPKRALSWEGVLLALHSMLSRTS